jgi:hypothetical protein
MPMWAMCEPSGPIENGTTYSVRPFMAPRNSACSPVCSSVRISAGAIQLLVGPASSGRSLQMKVRSSTRATSLGSLLARKLCGRNSGFSRFMVPASTSCAHRRSYSSLEPSHQCTAAASVSAATSATHDTSRSCFT